MAMMALMILRPGRAVICSTKLRSIFKTFTFRRCRWASVEYRSEVVQGEEHPELGQRRQGRSRVAELTNDCRLGDLQAELGRHDTVFVDGGGDAVDQRQVRKLLPDTFTETMKSAGNPLARPLRQLPACLVQHESVDGAY